MKAAITAVGTATPFCKYSQQEVMEILLLKFTLSPLEKRLIKSVYKATGIEYRYSVLSNDHKNSDTLKFLPNEHDVVCPTTAVRMQVYKNNALELALACIKNCLASANNFDKSQISHLITVSCTGMYAPGIDIELVQQLNLKSTVKRTAINFMGCYGAFNGIKVAETICKAEPDAKVLVVCVELCTIHFQKTMTPDNIVANAIFSDGAGAMLIEASPEQKKYFDLECFYCDLLPNTSDQMAWHIGDQGFGIVLSSYVPQAIKSGIGVAFDKLLTQSELKSLAMDYYAIHPGGVKILEACEEALGISKQDNQYAYQVLRQYGNMSSATIVFVLKELWNAITAADNNKNIFSCAFGPGLTFESMILKVQHG